MMAFQIKPWADAPLDGTPILVLSHGAWDIAVYDKTWADADDDGWRTHAYHKDFRPTGWCHLPPTEPNTENTP